MTERTLREKISELIEEAMVNAEVDYPVDERAGPRIEWQHEQLMEDIGALLDAHTAEQPAPTDDAAHCEYCDGTGDAHRIDGEWLGTCDCALARANHTAEQPADLQLSAPKVGSAPQDQTEVSSGPSAAPTDNTALVEALTRYDPGYCDRMGNRPEMTVEPEGDYLLRDDVIAALASREAKPGPDALVEADAWRDVLAERQRQISVEGWTPDHDDCHDRSELAQAAACYALSGTPADEAVFIHGRWKDPRDLFWPWGRSWWKPTDRRRDLVKAGALILAEIERLDRAALAVSDSKEGRDNPR